LRVSVLTLNQLSTLYDTCQKIKLNQVFGNIN